MHNLQQHTPSPWIVFHYSTTFTHNCLAFTNYCYSLTHLKSTAASVWAVSPRIYLHTSSTVICGWIHNCNRVACALTNLPSQTDTSTSINNGVAQYYWTWQCSTTFYQPQKAISQTSQNLDILKLNIPLAHQCSQTCERQLLAEDIVSLFRDLEQ